MIAAACGVLEVVCNVFSGRDSGAGVGCEKDESCDAANGVGGLGVAEPDDSCDSLVAFGRRDGEAGFDTTGGVRAEEGCPDMHGAAAVWVER